MEIVSAFVVYVVGLLFASLAFLNIKIKKSVIVLILLVGLIAGFVDIRNRFFDSPKEPTLEVVDLPSQYLNNDHYLKFSLPVRNENNNYAYHVVGKAHTFIYIKDTLKRSFASPDSDLDIVKRKDKLTATFSIHEPTESYDSLYLVTSFNFRDQSGNAQTTLFKIYRLDNGKMTEIDNSGTYASLKREYIASGILADYR